MTFAKTDQAICKVGAYAGVSLTDTGNGLPSNNVIFIDESDRYCSSLLSGCIDNAVSCPIDIFPFVQLFFEKLRLFHDKYTGFENQFQKQKSMWSSFFNVYGNPVSDRKFEEYLNLDKGNGEMLDKCLQILERCVTKIKKYKERYQIEFGDVTKYCSEEENGIPTLNVDTWNQVEVLTGVRNDEQLFICKNDEDSTLYIQPIAKSAKEEDTARRFTDFIRDTVLCIGDILALCRTFVNTYEKLNSGSTLYQALRSVLGRIAGIELAKEYYEFVSHNLYGYKNQTVRENSFYARGFMIIKLVRNAVSSQRTQIKAYKVSQLPDYKLANMIYSHDKVIFSSGTAELRSISNADMSYIEKSVMDKMRYDVGCLDEETGEAIKKRAFVSVERIQKSRDILMRMQSEDAPFWYSLKESSVYAEKQLKEMQRKKLEGKQIHICTYDREAHAKDNKKDCFYDMQRLAEATGKNIEELRYYLTYNQKDGSVANAKSFGRVAFAMWALEQMIRNGVQTGLIYQNALPLLEWNLSGEGRGAADNQNVYTMKILKDLAVCVAQKYGIVPEKIRIERCDTKTLKTHIEALSEGLYPDEIYLLLSAYDSLGAGTDLYYRKRNANGEVVKIKAGDSMEDRYDLDAIFLDEVTNVIKSSHDNEEKSIVRTQLSAEYEVSKIAKIEAARGEFTAESGMKKLPFIMKQIQAGKGFDKCLYKEDPQSPYHHEIMAKVLQAYGRIDRGKQKHSSVIVAASDTLLNSAGIGSQSYQNVPTCYMFDLLLQKADQMHNKQQKPDSLSQYEREYQENNEKYNAWIWEIMKRISSFKTDKNLIKLRSTIRVYEIARKNVFTMGYGKENVSGFYDIPDKNGKPDDYWGVSLGRIEHPEKGYSWQADLKRMNGAFLTNGKTYVDIRSGKEHLKALDAYVERGYLGEGWEAEFATILENWEAILRNGFKYPPYAETYYIFLGIFYEKLLLCMLGNCETRLARSQS